MNATYKKEASRLSKIRLEMLEIHPFWGYLLLQVRLIPAPQLQCLAATDCVRQIWYNPELTRSLSDEQLGFVLAHEIGHQVYATSTRQGRRNAHLWNCATDYAINRIISKIRHPIRTSEALYQLPDGKHPKLGEIKILLDPQYEGMVAETIYERLDEQNLPSPQSTALFLPIESFEDENGTSQEEETIRLPNLSDHGGGIDIHLPDFLSSEDYEELEQRLREAVQYWQNQEGKGNIPLQELQDLKFSNEARVDWRSVLRNHAEAVSSPDEYTLSKPNRRYLELDFVVPGLQGQRVPHLAVSIDTSGSMTKDMVQEVGRELRHLATNVDRMTLLVADQEILEVIEDGDLDRFLSQETIKGGRGTDHRPVFEWIDQQLEQPSLYIGMTDLQSRFPQTPPQYPVLWLTPYDDYPKPPWGLVVPVQAQAGVQL